MKNSNQPTGASLLPFMGRLGGAPIIKQVPPESVGGKTLFAGTDGKFYSAKGRELKPCTNPASTYAHKGGSAYARMRQFDNRLCHHLIWETWVGPRTPGMEIDHINGDKMNWSLDNLEEVTPAENRKRAVLLRELRRNGRDPKMMTRDELQAIFRKYRIVDPEAQMDREISSHQEC